MMRFDVEGKKIKVTLNTGVIFEGVGIGNEDDYESGYDEPVLFLETESNTNYGYEFKDSEIVSIEVLE